MIKLLLGLDSAPSPHDAADALAVAVCHLHHLGGAAAVRQALREARTGTGVRTPRTWRDYRPPGA
jgi:hypothetical protein